MPELHKRIGRRYLLASPLTLVVASKEVVADDYSPEGWGTSDALRTSDSNTNRIEGPVVLPSSGPITLVYDKVEKCWRTCTLESLETKND